MDILFRRRQTPGRFRSVKFKVWAKIELDSEEHALIRRYDFDDSILIYSPQENLKRNALIFGLLCATITFFIVAASFGRAFGGTVGVIALILMTWFWYDWFRETIYVKYLMHGRGFVCRNIVDLARREAWIAQICSYLRHVMESAKHWDGEESIQVPPLDPETSKQFMLKGPSWFDM